MSGESRYEGLEVPTSWPKPGEPRREPIQYLLSLRALEARQAFWAHLLNSGCAGHTYGANGIWQVNLPGKPFGASSGGHHSLWKFIPAALITALIMFPCSPCSRLRSMRALIADCHARGYDISSSQNTRFCQV